MATYVKKKWGSEVWLYNTDEYCSKILYVHPEARGSKHRHLIKAETFVVVRGAVILEIWENGKDCPPISHFLLGSELDSYNIAAGIWHRFTSLKSGAAIVESSMKHDDRDVEREET